MKDNFPNNNSKKLEADIEKVLNNIYPKNQQVKVRDTTPEVLLNNNVKNLPMLITQRHIKSIIYPLKEAKKLKLPTKNINYHGLGKELFLKVINNLDNPKAVYKKEESDFNEGIQYSNVADSST